MQTDWIGKSYGAEVDFRGRGTEMRRSLFTPPDRIPCMVQLSWYWLRSMRWQRAWQQMRLREAVEKYIFDSSMRSNVDRLQDKEKTGVFTGSLCNQPAQAVQRHRSGCLIMYLADYGTGAIMCVPAHDDRDFEFAKKFNIPIIQVIAKDGKEIENMTEAYTEASGTMINSGEWNGMESSVLKKEAPKMIEERGLGKADREFQTS